MREYISQHRRRDKSNTNVCIKPRRETFNTSPSRCFHKSEKEAESSFLQSAVFTIAMSVCEFAQKAQL